jgi:predicted Rossmann fold flavoprotein
MTKWQVIVVGEGAAGLMAASQAAQSRVRTLLLGKTDRPGLKLSITGNGRCNLTNTAPISEFIKRFGPNGRFLRQAFQHFFNDDLIAFFEKLGVLTVTEADGCVFPKSQKAQDIVDTLVKWNRKNGVHVQLLSPVKRLVVEQGKVAAVCTDKETFETSAVIIATGGASYPSTGSSGDGYQLAESVGHTIIPIKPALVPLETAGQLAQKLQGVSISNAIVKVLVDGKKKIQTQGDVLFTHFGLSGPVILSLSKQVIELLSFGGKVSISIDLLPDFGENQLEETLVSQLRSHGRQQFKTILKAYLPSRLIYVCFELNNINPEKICNQITADERKKIKTLLKNFRLEVTGHSSLKEAIVTAGGVDVHEVDPRTMQSLKVKGLYFAGEILDIDGDTGGFNLQAAFSTGWLAGISAAKSTTE